MLLRPPGAHAPGLSEPFCLLAARREGPGTVASEQAEAMLFPGFYALGPDVSFQFQKSRRVGDLVTTRASRRSAAVRGAEFLLPRMFLRRKLCPSRNWRRNLQILQNPTCADTKRRRMNLENSSFYCRFHDVSAQFRGIARPSRPRPRFLATRVKFGSEGEFLVGREAEVRRKSRGIGESFWMKTFK